MAKGKVSKTEKMAPKKSMPKIMKAAHKAAPKKAKKVY